MTSKVKNPSDKILLVEEDTGTLDDAWWAPDLPVPQYFNLLSTRHDRRKLQRDDTGTLPPNPDRRGNVLFADGHAEYVTRSVAHAPAHYLPKF